jgi:hypothetical protein
MIYMRVPSGERVTPSGFPSCAVTDFEIPEYDDDATFQGVAVFWMMSAPLPAVNVPLLV